MHINAIEMDCMRSRKCNNKPVAGIRQTNYVRCEHLDTTANALCEKINGRYVRMEEVAVRERYDSFGMIHA